MYGTIGTFKVKPGKQAELIDELQRRSADINGFLIAYLFQSENDPGTLTAAIVFESREAYRANAEDPAQHASYVAYRALLEEDPRWNDGVVIASND